MTRRPYIPPSVESRPATSKELRAAALAELPIYQLGQYAIHVMSASEQLTKADEIFPMTGDFAALYASLLKEMKEELARRLVIDANRGAPS